MTENKSLIDLIKYIKRSIDIMLEKKHNEEIEKYSNTEFSPAIEYEKLLQKEEKTHRENIKAINRYKLQCECYFKEIDSLKEEKEVLLLQIVSNIIIIKIFNNNNYRRN